ncbi:hypothetical protein MWG07_12050 [Fusobacterium necrophorum]|uniref:HTH cro/C1-type domain-containing protein n=2 Tax=Fusobacterium necrophorum TaxID=859 RepID=A0AAW6WEU9_9FUSO|nr:S24 family peptidase [Fusobacterium necrophorum]KYM56209.1 hypothetical protein A2U17_00140 [Fusobacterium necrophorum subsp. funduliforme]MDK4482083.1 hypothetical protein [Fusobacterium necrophorum]MDK4512983.1 hypothetical protein [Fusobacterium necrophorum]
MKLKDKDVKELGTLMRNRRIEKNYTLGQVQFKLEKLGLICGKSDIQRIEEGVRTTPNPILLSRLCKLYGIDEIKLFKKIGYLPEEEINEKESQMVQEEKTYYNINNSLKKIKVYSSILEAFGYFRETMEDVYDEVYFSMEEFKGKDICGVWIQEESMKPELGDNSLIFIEKNTPILHNEIGVFYLNGQLLLKRKIETEEKNLILFSEDRNYNPILVKKEDDYKELGKIIGIYHKFCNHNKEKLV